jgi:hypothetical protein
VSIGIFSTRPDLQTLPDAQLRIRTQRCVSDHRWPVALDRDALHSAVNTLYDARTARISGSEEELEASKRHHNESRGDGDAGSVSTRRGHPDWGRRRPSPAGHDTFGPGKTQFDPNPRVTSPVETHATPQLAAE